MKNIIFILLFCYPLLAQNLHKNYDWQAWERFFTDKSSWFMDVCVAKGLLTHDSKGYHVTLPVQKVFILSTYNNLKWWEIQTDPDTLYFCAGKDFFAFEGETAIDPDTLRYVEITFSKPKREFKLETKLSKNGTCKPKQGNHYGWYLEKDKREKKLKDKEKDKIKTEKVESEKVKNVTKQRIIPPRELKYKKVN